MLHFACSVVTILLLLIRPKGLHNIHSIAILTPQNQNVSGKNDAIDMATCIVKFAKTMPH